MPGRKAIRKRDKVRRGFGRWALSLGRQFLIKQTTSSSIPLSPTWQSRLPYRLFYNELRTPPNPWHPQWSPDATLSCPFSWLPLPWLLSPVPKRWAPFRHARRERKSFTVRWVIGQAVARQRALPQLVVPRLKTETPRAPSCTPCTSLPSCFALWVACCDAHHPTSRLRSTAAQIFNTSCI